MNRSLRLAFILAGAAGLFYLVHQAGAARLLADAARTGWMFVPIMAVYGVSYVCYAWVWHSVMSDEPARPPFGRTLAITVSSYSLDFVTPMLNVGGEPFRIAAAAPWVGPQRATGGVVTYKLLHTLANSIVWLAAVLTGFVLLPRNPAVVAALTLALVIVLGLIALLWTLHRRGGLERILDLLHRLPVVKRLGARLEPHRTTLVALDRQIIEFYERNPARFGRAVAIECVGRLAYMFEYYLIAMSIDLPIGLAGALVIGGLSSLFTNLTFFIPFELGTKEGSHYLLFELLGLDPALGVYAAMVTRARDLAWIAIGLSLAWFSGSRVIMKEAA